MIGDKCGLFPSTGGIEPFPIPAWNGTERELKEKVGFGHGDAGPDWLKGTDVQAILRSCCGRKNVSG